VKSVHQEIKAACSRADAGLWEAFTRSHNGNASGASAGKLVFPDYRGGSLRVSEQEARFAFVEALCSGPLLYSVEAPTSKQYQFTGKSALSAQTDLAIFDNAKDRICNVEFKAKGVSPSAKKHFPIYKDLQKLLREPLWGLWFHLLEAVNNSTINDLLTVMADEMEKVRVEFGKDVEAPGLMIHVCVLQHGFSIQRDVVLKGGAIPKVEELRRLLQVDLKVSRSELLAVGNTNGWDLNTQGIPPANKRMQPTS